MLQPSSPQFRSRADQVLGSRNKQETQRPTSSFQNKARKFQIGAVYTKWVTDWWCLELFSCIIAALAVFSIALTLAIHNNRSLPNWPFSITINTLLSVFSQIGQMATLLPIAECMGQLKWHFFTARKRPLTQMQDFDSASRGGPVGNIRLLWGLKFRLDTHTLLRFEP